MSRHAADKPRSDEGGRLKHYTEIDRDQGGPRDQTLALQRRPREKGADGARAREFTRIDRGQDA